MPTLKLTKRVIDALPTPAKDVVHWDSACPGFRARTGFSAPSWDAMISWRREWC
jgi:hypothetical protein